ncbi:MAG: acyltransferase [Lactobacillus sp.]|nr:acyltransferase [Lactobacillus sp.]
MKKRIFWLDFAKGFTIFLVVFGHVLAAIFNNIDVDDGSGTMIFKLIMYLIFLIIMPIFFALSGFLYRDILSLKAYRKMLLKKLISLGVPYLIFSILLVVLAIFFKLNVDGVSELKDLLYIGVRPIAYLWFLQALFLAFAIVGAFSLLKIKPQLQVIILLCGTFIGELVLDKQFYFYVMQSFSWALCFYLGYLIKCNENLLNKRVALISGGLMIFSTIWQISAEPEWYLQGDFFNFENTLGKFASIFVFLYIYRKVSTSNALFQRFSNYGRESLIIYLVHVPVISLIRKIMMVAGITNVIAIFCVCLLGSWYLSIFASWIVKNYKPLDFIFYPLIYIKLK